MKKIMIFLMFITINLSANAQNYKLTGNLGEDKASMTLKKSGNVVKGTIIRCDYCLPIKVEGLWKNDSIKIAGYSQAGSYIQYELFVSCRCPDTRIFGGIPTVMCTSLAPD